MCGESPFKKTKGLTNRIWDRWRSLKFIVDAVDHKGRRVVNPLDYFVEVEETGNRGFYLRKKGEQGYSFKRKKDGTLPKGECYLYFDREYSDENHLIVTSCYYYPVREKITDLKKNTKYIENIPLFQIRLKPIKSVFEELILNGSRAKRIHEDTK